MSGRKFNPVILLLLVVLIPVGFWFFAQSPSPTPEKYTPVKIASPAPVLDKAAIKARISALVAPPAARPKNDFTPILVTAPADAATPDHADPQSELKTAIPEIARLWREGKIADLRMTYDAPGRISPEMVQLLLYKQQEINDLIAAHPEVQQTYRDSMEAGAKPYEELEGQIPLYNDAGDEATYQMRQEDGSYAPAVFVKINGKWYRQ